MKATIHKASRFFLKYEDLQVFVEIGRASCRERV